MTPKADQPTPRSAPKISPQPSSTFLFPLPLNQSLHLMTSHLLMAAQHTRDAVR
ncbi:unnamed protein product [Periconia digitata]|uniref:Uncharacterized protein n=1 Tax=Periconia digitata TaxID=1303443 RepID=A0A9W4XR62_9PLEO|nr:unnamed protein product [Periconia digitata]